MAAVNKRRYKMMTGLTEMGADICSTIRSYDMDT